MAKIVFGPKLAVATRVILGKPKRRSACVFLTIGALTAFAPSPAVAQDTHGHVLELQGDELVVDLTLHQGAQRGDVIELWRPLRLKHPVTGRTVSDRFEIGRLRLIQVRDNLALARIEGEPSRPPAVGDLVVLQRTSAPTTAPGVEQGPGARTLGPSAASPAPVTTTVLPPGNDAEAALVVALFESLRGAPLATRVRNYEAFASANPKNRFSRTLREEALLLRRAYASSESRGDKATPGLKAAAFIAPESVTEGQLPTVALQIEGPARGAVLFTRGPSDVGYVATPMGKAGDGYFQAAIPAAQARAPRVEYFIEAVDQAGHGIPIVAKDQHPAVLDIQHEPDTGAEKPYEMSATVLTDYADWNNLEGNDWAWQTEGAVGVRIDDKGLRALRTGFGVYRGVGGSLEELDELRLSARQVGLTYGYLEAEWGVSAFTGLISRAIIGLRERGVTGGAQAFVRLGNDKATNLQIGGEVLGGIGLRGITELQLSTFQRFPLMFRTEVTNQPAGATPKGPRATGVSSGRADIGARAIAQLGFRVLPSLTLAARGSYEGRTINHAGPGFGGAVSYQW